MLPGSDLRSNGERTARKSADGEARLMPTGRFEGPSLLRDPQAAWSHNRPPPSRPKPSLHPRWKLEPMARQAREAMGWEDLTALADRGYYNGEQVLACEAAGAIPYVPEPLTSGAKADGRFIPILIGGVISCALNLDEVGRLIVFTPFAIVGFGGHALRRWRRHLLRSARRYGEDEGDSGEGPLTPRRARCARPLIGRRPTSQSQPGRSQRPLCGVRSSVGRAIALRQMMPLSAARGMSVGSVEALERTGRQLAIARECALRLVDPSEIAVQRHRVSAGATASSVRRRGEVGK